MINISFRRHPMDSRNSAWCRVEQDNVNNPPIYRHVTGGATIYKMILRLCDAGLTGQNFIAHDGHIPCLEGTISRRSVPVLYGGDPMPTKSKKGTQR